MGTLRITTLAAALITAAMLTVGATVPAAADVVGHGWGSGSTSAAAKTAATEDLIGDYYGCKTPYVLNYDTQGSGGGWSAEVSADCIEAR